MCRCVCSSGVSLSRPGTDAQKRNELLDDRLIFYSLTHRVQVTEWARRIQASIESMNRLVDGFQLAGGASSSGAAAVNGGSGSRGVAAAAVAAPVAAPAPLPLRAPPSPGGPPGLPPQAAPPKAVPSPGERRAAVPQEKQRQRQDRGRTAEPCRPRCRPRDWKASLPRSWGSGGGWKVSSRAE